MRPQLNIQLTSCAHREVSGGTVSSMEIFRLKTRLLYTWILYQHDALIGRARSIACSHFLKSHIAECMLFIDDDMLFMPEDIEKIYQEIKSGKDLVGGCYVVKDGSQLSSAGVGGPIELDGRVISIDYLATGFMGISWRLLDRMVKELDLTLLHKGEWAECYPFFESGYRKATDNFKGIDIYISEDWDFCDKARKIGVQPYLHTGIWLGHLGGKIWDINDYGITQAMKQSMQSPEIAKLAEKFSQQRGIRPASVKKDIHRLVRAFLGQDRPAPTETPHIEGSHGAKAH